MVKRFNDIKVLFTRHSDKVLIDSTPDGKVVLFNHNNLLKCSLGVFTGIDFELGSGVGFFLTTVLGEPVEFLYWNHGIVGRCADNQLYSEPIFIATFTPVANKNVIFNGHLIELKK